MADKPTTKPFNRLIKLVSRERDDIIHLLMLTFGYGLLSIATPVAVQTLVNNVVIGGVIQPLVVVSLILLSLLVLASIIYLMEVYLVEIIQRKIFVHSASRISNNISGVKLSVYDNNNPVELMNRFFDVMTVQKSAAVLLTVSLTAVLQGVIGSVILLFYSAYFTAAVVVIFIVLAFIVLTLGKHAEASAIKESSSKYKMAAWLENMARNLTLSKFFKAHERNDRRTDELATEYLYARKKHFSILMRQQIGVFILYAFMGTAILVLSGLLVIWGVINLGQFVAAELIIFGVLASFVRFVTKLETYYDMLAALNKLGEIFDLPQERHNTHKPNGEINQLTVEALHFSHTPSLKQIHDLGFSVAAGSSLAILGDSGAGKTVLMELLTGMREFGEGQIKYNNIDIRQLDLAYLRDQMTLAANIEVVDGTILENLRLTRNEIGLEEVHTVLTELAFVDDINQLKDGLSTQLTALGEPLSTTQLERLMLARALIGSPKIVLIDGLLDSLSPQELKVVGEYLNRRKENAIIIVTTREAKIAALFDAQVNLVAETDV